MWANIASVISQLEKAHKTGECKPDLKREGLTKDYTLLVQSCFDISVKNITDYITGGRDNKGHFSEHTQDLMVQINKNFFMFDKLIDDLEKLEKSGTCDNVKKHIQVSEIQRLKDTFLKLVGKLLACNKAAVTAFYNDKTVNH
jgi:hypothetical protein